MHRWGPVVPGERDRTDQRERLLQIASAPCDTETRRKLPVRRGSPGRVAISETSDMSRPLSRAPVAALADDLKRVLYMIENGEIEASAATRHRIEGGLT